MDEVQDCHSLLWAWCMPQEAQKSTTAVSSFFFLRGASRILTLLSVLPGAPKALTWEESLLVRLRLYRWLSLSVTHDASVTHGASLTVCICVSCSLSYSSAACCLALFVRVAVDMNFHIHIHIHRFYVDIHGYIHIHRCLSCIHVSTEYPIKHSWFLLSTTSLAIENVGK